MESIVPARVNVGNYRQSVLPVPGGSAKQEGDAEFKLPNENTGPDENDASAGRGGKGQAAPKGASQTVRDRRAKEPEGTEEASADAVAASTPAEVSRAENISSNSPSTFRKRPAQHLLGTDYQHLTKSSQRPGMVAAHEANSEMSRLLKTRSHDTSSPRWQLSEGKLPRQIVKAAALVQQPKSRTGFALRKEQDRKEAASMSPLLHTRTHAAGEANQAEPVQQVMEINPLLLRAIARMQGGNHSTLRLAMRTPDGQLLNVQLKVRDGRMSALFRTADKALQQTIEQGWGALARELDKQGLQLEAPEFEANQPRFEEKHYA